MTPTTRRPTRTRTAALALVAFVIAAALLAGCTDDGGDADAERTTAEPTLDTASNAAPTPQQAVRDRLAAVEAERAAAPGRTAIDPAAKLPVPKPEVPPSVCLNPTKGSTPPPNGVLVRSPGESEGFLIPASKFDIRDCKPLVDWWEARGLIAPMEVVPAAGMVLRCSLGTTSHIFGQLGADPQRGGCFVNPNPDGGNRITWEITSAANVLATYHECRWCDLSGQDLRSATRIKVNSVSDSKFDGATLQNFDFIGAKIARTSFAGATIESSAFTTSALTDVSFAGTTIRDTVFADATLVRVKFSKGKQPTQLVRVFLPARLDDVSFDDALLVDVDGMWQMDQNPAYTPGMWGCTSFRNVVLAGVEPLNRPMEDTSLQPPTPQPATHVDGTAATARCDKPFSGSVLDTFQLLRLRGADLTAVSVVNAPGSTDLVNADLSRTALAGALFVGGPPNLSGADLSGSVLDGVDLHDARFAGTAVPARPQGTRTTGSGLDIELDVPSPAKAAQAANLRGASLQGTTLTGAWMPGVALGVLDGAADATAKLGGANFSGANLAGADLSSAEGGGPKGKASFVGAYLAGTTFKDFEGTDVRFDRAHLLRSAGRATTFESATLTSADFPGAMLGEVNFDGATLSSADFTGALCAGCRFTSVAVDGLVFEKGTMVGAVWDNLSATAGARLSGTKIVDGTGTFTMPVAPLEGAPAISYRDVTFPAGAWAANVTCPNDQPASSNGCTGKLAVANPPKLPACTSAGPFRCPGTIDPWPTDAGATPIDVAQSTEASATWAVATTEPGQLLMMVDDQPRWATVEGLGVPGAIAAMPDGSYLVTDPDAHRVWKVRITIPTDGGPATGTATPFAGTGEAGNGGDGGPATEATLGSPTGVWVDAEGVAYVTDPDHAQVRAIWTDGTIEDRMTQTGLETPTGISGDSRGYLYVVDPGAGKVLRINPAGATDGPGSGVTAFVGTGSTDGDRCPTGGCKGTAVSLAEPTDVVVLETTSASKDRPTGTPTILIADRGTASILAVDADGVVVPRFAGTGESGPLDGEGLAAEVALAGPIGLSVDPGSRRVYVADQSSTGAAIRLIALP